MEKNYSTKKAKQMIALLFLSQILVGVIGWCLSAIPITGTIESWIDVDITKWFVYYFPLTRVLDFAIGCNVGYLFLNRDIEKSQHVSKEMYTKLELLTIVFIIIGNVCCTTFITTWKEELPIAYSKWWWRYSILWTMSSCLLIYLFAVNKGCISKVLTNRAMIYLGNISQYTFLIHYVVFRYIRDVCRILKGEEFAICYACWIELTVGFVLTLIATQIWMKLIHKKIKF